MLVLLSVFPPTFHLLRKRQKMCESAQKFSKNAIAQALWCCLFETPISKKKVIVPQTRYFLRLAKKSQKQKLLQRKPTAFSILQIVKKNVIMPHQTSSLHIKKNGIKRCFTLLKMKSTKIKRRFTLAKICGKMPENILHFLHLFSVL